MDSLFKSLKSLIKTSSVIIDNYIFRLHYRLTVTILMAFSLMVTSRQYFGDPIDCMPVKGIPNKLLDTYCWIRTTFSVESAWNKRVGVDVPYPGVGNSKSDEKRVYHSYYQWVCFMLFIQAILFYVPRYIWKATEGGRLKNIILGLDSPMIEEETRNTKRALLVEYVYNNMNNQDPLFIMYTTAEVLNFLNVVLQMFLMDRFLGGEFLNYGWDVLSFTEWEPSVRYDPMIKVFPRLTKCIFHMTGPSGDIEKRDSMCILPINIINEKIYIFLWFWFYFLAAISLIGLIYRFITIVVPRVRFMAIYCRSRITDEATLSIAIDQGNISHWFLLNLLSKNLDPLNFRDLIFDLSKRIEQNKAQYL